MPKTIDQQLEELTRPTQRAYERGRRDAIVDRNLEDLQRFLGIGTLVGGAVAAKKMSAAKKRAAMLDDPDVPLTPELQQQHDNAKRAREAIRKYKQKRIATQQDIINKIAFDLDIEPWQVNPDTWALGPMQAKMARKLRAEDEYHKGVDAIGAKVRVGPPGSQEDMFVKESLIDTKFKKDVKPQERKNLKMQKMQGRSVYDYRDDMLNRVFLQEMLQPEIGADTYYMQRKTGKKGSPVTIAQEFLENKTINQPKKAYERFNEEQALRNAMRELGVEPQDMHGWNMGRAVDGNLKARDVGHAFPSKLREIIGTKKGKEIAKKAMEEKNVLSKTNKRLYSKVAKQLGKKFAKGAGPIGGLFLGALMSGDSEASTFTPSVTPMGAASNVDSAVQELLGRILLPAAGNAELPPEEMLKRAIVNERMKANQ